MFSRRIRFLPLAKEEGMSESDKITTNDFFFTFLTSFFYSVELHSLFWAQNLQKLNYVKFLLSVLS